MIACILSGLAAARIIVFLAESAREIASVLLLFQLPVLLPLLAFLAQAALAWIAGHVFLALVAARVVRNLRHPENEADGGSPAPAGSGLKEIAA